ncbi:hypothetical protein BDU57DRAFT_526781 [Ampelomyces quisqualis]|uniref:SHSP domain-containing protein n=1 Tax=Ampelomyces quisqualis TaxID=50730 RepID=A0A6A5R3X3_AMPQU|nr:hypothetical protein BDU57DRAFT_526781 [Ampelomyces quisqualis]
MAFVLTPRFAPAYETPQCSPFGFCAPASRSAYACGIARPRPERPQYPSFNHFFRQVDELLGDINREAEREAQRQAQIEAYREAQREAHRQRQQRKRALRARFAVSQTKQGWQVDGEFQGFEQENISIELTDEHTLKIAGNTQWQAEKKAEPEQQHVEAVAAPATEQQPTDHSVEDKTEPEYETVTQADTANVGTTTPDSDTQSHKSYQPTVEEDYEDLGAEISSLVSSPSRPSSPTAVKEPKGKEKAVDEPITAAVTQQPPTEVPAQQQQGTQQEERAHGSFERTFRFPERIDAANVSAKFEDGTLRITLPKAQVLQVKRIAIL